MTSSLPHFSGPSLIRLLTRSTAGTIFASMLPGPCSWALRRCMRRHACFGAGSFVTCTHALGKFGLLRLASLPCAVREVPSICVSGKAYTSVLFVFVVLGVYATWVGSVVGPT